LDEKKALSSLRNNGEIQISASTPLAADDESLTFPASSLTSARNLASPAIP